MAPIPAPIAGADVLQQVNGPAIGLIVVAVLGFFLQVANIVFQKFFAALAARQTQGMPAAFSGSMTIGFGAVAILVSVLILFGGIKMRKLENHGLAMAASILAMIPCISPCCLIGLPIGIWAVIVLSKPEVKGAFR
jgi:hypothetical protein